MAIQIVGGLKRKERTHAHRHRSQDFIPNVDVIVSEPAALWRQNLPIRGRNFQEFAQLSPNTTQESNRGGIVINGQRSINANISIDGVDYNDPLQNGPRGGGPKEAAFSFPQSAVREFQVVLNGVSAGYCQLGKPTDRIPV